MFAREILREGSYHRWAAKWPYLRDRAEPVLGHDIHPPAERPFDAPAERHEVGETITRSQADEQVYVARRAPLASRQGTENPDALHPMPAGDGPNFLSFCRFDHRYHLGCSREVYQRPRSGRPPSLGSSASPPRRRSRNTTASTVVSRKRPDGRFGNYPVGGAERVVREPSGAIEQPLHDFLSEDDAK
jgi:hypothetical protein